MVTGPTKRRFELSPTVVDIRCAYKTNEGLRLTRKPLHLLYGAYEIRTRDLFNAIEARYQLR